MVASALRQVARNPALLRLEASWLTAFAADGAYLVSLLVFAYDIGGVAAVGLIAMVRSLPAGLIAPILISFADRYPPARVLLALHLTRAAMVAVVAATAAADLPAGIAVGAAVVEGLLLGLHRATTLTFMPGLARSPEELVAGNAAISLGEGLGTLVGPVVAGVLLALGGPALGLAMAAAAHLGAALIVVSIDAPVAPRRSASAAGTSSRLNSALAGFGALRQYPSAGLIIGLFASQSFVRGALTVMLVAIAVELLRIGDSGVGYLASTLGAGGLVGAGLAMAVVAGRRLATPFAVSLAMWGVPILLIGLLPQAVVAFVLVGVVGAANATLDVSGFTLLQRTVPNELRARTFGALEGVASIAIAGGAGVTPVVVGAVGIEVALLIIGALLPILALVSYPLVRRADDAAVVPHRELGLLRGIPMFAPLPLTMVEHLAGSLEPVDFGAGERIITQGESGDCFYVVAEGSVEIVHDGRLVTVLGPGDSFGEIALLSDRPRTASVRARQPMAGYRLDRVAFLEAVTGSRPAALAGDALVATRLTELGDSLRD